MPALAVTVVSPPAPPTPKHPFARYVIIGMVSRVRAAVLVRLPAAYFDPAQRARRFPVVETFHGTPGHAPQWLGKLRLGDVIDREAAAGRMSEAIVVSPEMNYPDQADRECVDGGPGRPALETWATRDVPNWLISTFRIRTDPGSWATIGLSAGGWCAAMSTMLHPDRYRAAIVMSGYFRPEFSGPTPYLTSPGRASRYDLVALAHSAPPPVAVWLLTSPRDGGSYPTCQELADARAPLSVTSVVLPGQDHAWDVWARFLVTALDWLARSAPGFAPSSPPAR